MSAVLLFPGQGSQFVGMGRELYQTYPEARYCFESVDEALKENLTKVIFEGDLETLTKTSNAQPAIMTVSMAALFAILKQGGYSSISSFTSITAGHSLGEYSALCAANAFTLEDTARLLRTRGLAMEDCALKAKERCGQEGAMVALLGVQDLESIKNLIAATFEALDKERLHEVCEIANDNGAGQVVLSGTSCAMSFIEENARNFGCAKAIRLNVSGAFHSSMLESAKPTLRNALERISIFAPICNVVANIDASPYMEHDASTVTNAAVKADISTRLTEQICNPIKWRESMDYIAQLIKTKIIDNKNDGLERSTLSGGISLANTHPSFVVEIGPGRVLSGLWRKMHPNIEAFNVCDPESVEKFLKLLSQNSL